MTAHLIVLPGGGYRTLASHEGQPVAEWLTQLGLSAEVCEYPVRCRHPAPLQAVADAIRRARAVGHERVGVIGFSAGGHLAGLAALTSPGGSMTAVDFAILGYPIVSMQRNLYPSAGEILIGNDAKDELRAATSVDRLVTEAAPPFFLWHTAEDRYVPVSETYLLASALQANGVPHATHVFAHGPHSLGLARDAGEAAQWTDLAQNWLHMQALIPRRPA